MPGNVTLMCTPSLCIEEMSRAYLPNEYYYNVTILNVDFSDSGIYSCFPGNNAFIAAVDDPAANHAHSYHLRVKGEQASLSLRTTSLSVRRFT